MIEIRNHSKFLSLEKQVENQREQGKAVLPFAFIPDGLEAYCKVFYTICRDVDLDSETRDWSNYPRDDSSFETLTKRKFCPKANFNAKRVLWKELAKEQRIEFGQHLDLTSYPIWSVKYVYDEASLIDCQTANRLTDILIKSGSTKDYYFGYWTWKENQDNSYTRLYEANLIQDGVLTNTESVLRGTLAFWWSIDDTWFMGTTQERGSYFSCFGASHKLINMILDDDFLESVEVR